MFIRFLLPILLFSLTPTLNNCWFGSKSKPSYPVSGKLVKDMNEQELNLVLEYGKIVDDSELVFKCYFYLIGLSGQQATIKTYKLGLADYLFQREDYEKASIGYEEFFLLYPGSQEAEYAQYKSILCSFFLCLSSDRDQTQTLKTISLVQFFLARAKDTKFIDESKEMYITCRKKLFEHEVHVFAHYISRNKFTSAQKRIEHIEKNFTDIADLDLYVSYCKEMMEICKNPNTCPFFLKFDLKNALIKKDKPVSTTTPEEQKTSIKNTTAFFLA
jgi:outer membrane assembly lipoprotein YfiO